MSDLYWTVTPTATRDGHAFQARALGVVPTHAGIVDTRALGPYHLAGADASCARRAAEADGWRSGLACDPGYTPLTRPPVPKLVIAPAPVPAPAPRLVVTAVPEPVLVPDPEPPVPVEPVKPESTAPAKRRVIPRRRRP